jgi:RNA polymerase sigma factor (sigma-70 family)
MTIVPELKEEIVDDLLDYLCFHYADILFQVFHQKINMLVQNYARKLPRYIKTSEIDDLNSIARMEFIQTLRSWHPLSNPVIWPFAYSRINGAMRDHIRYLTKADPSRLFNWINDAAYMYLAINRNKEEFEGQIDDGVILKQAMANLTEQEHMIVTMKSLKDMTLVEIGNAINLSESQVSRVYNGALEKLRKILSKK